MRKRAIRKKDKKKQRKKNKLCNKNQPKTQVNSFTAEGFVVQLTIIVNF